jgi:hypothetical protein
VHRLERRQRVAHPEEIVGCWPLNTLFPQSTVRSHDF